MAKIYDEKVSVAPGANSIKTSNKPLDQSGNNRARVSQYERSLRVPSLVEVQNYANAANIGVELLTNDNLDLPISIRRKARLNQDKRRRKSQVGKEPRKTNISVRKRGKKHHGAIYYAAAVQSAVIHNQANADYQPNINPQTEPASQSANKESFQTASDEEKQFQKTDGRADSAAKAVATADVISINDDDTATSSATVAAAPNAQTHPMHLSEETERICKPVYLELLGELPFGKMSLLTPEKFIELAFAVVANDFHTRESESAIAHRIRLLIENKDAG
jgi:hypothetical protein